LAQAIFESISPGTSDLEVFPALSYESLFSLRQTFFSQR